MVTVSFLHNEQKQFPRCTKIIDMLEGITFRYRSAIIAAKIGNALYDLSKEITEDCSIELIEIASAIGMQVYVRSLTFLMIAAAQDLYPGSEIVIKYSLSKGLYCEWLLGRHMTPADVKVLERHMHELVEKDLPIIEQTISREEAIKLFSANGQIAKVRLLKQMKRENVRVYYCGEAYSYLHGIMTPSTGYLDVFGLKYYSHDGFILRYPEWSNARVLPPFTDQPKLSRVFREAERWGKILKCDFVSSLNHCSNNGKCTGDIVRVAEALHEKKIAQIADMVAEQADQIRLITIAGPSSSGKTTFANRLAVQLMVNGLKPVRVSLDDYFVNRKRTPRDNNGELDFEALEAIDIELFNEHLTALLNGEEVEIPSFNFTTGEREYTGDIICLADNQPLIIEGIHGLNERLTESVPRHSKLKIYVSSITQLAVDNHNRIATTDARLIRRIVRDNNYRGHSALATLKMWPSVRRGEEKNIFPFQEEADIMFNSALIYELAVLGTYAKPLLDEITIDDEQYFEARRLIKLLSFFLPIDDKLVPNNSILREFIGGSCFQSDFTEQIL